jgi:hypothetical protein
VVRVTDLSQAKQNPEIDFAVKQLQKIRTHRADKRFHKLQIVEAL